jgi:16S rRNA A1518/A1519 N6-dimethyltransferase RsmA/KsgA/DIM1 with predicted DNA glycosylase/AP lyase activity
MLWAVFVCAFLLGFLYYMLKNRLAIYWPSSGKMVDVIEGLAGVKKGDVVYDLGSGDGRIVERLSRKAKKCVGVEHNNLLVSYSKKKLRGLKNVKIIHGNIFDQDLSDANVIVAYLSRPLIGALEKKIIMDCKKGTRIVLVGYKFSKLKMAKERKRLWIRIRLYLN